MKPAFRISADGADITALISDRLIELQLTDKPGLESDTFQITIDDRDGAVTLPRRGAARRWRSSSATTAPRLRAWAAMLWIR